MAVKILSWVLALLFLVAGVPKIIGASQVAAGFEHMGYSPAFRILIGVLETIGGLGLLVAAVAPYAILLLLVIMGGALWTVLSIGDSALPPLITGALLVVLGILRLRPPTSR
jgi:putative oxidoreductase